MSQTVRLEAPVYDRLEQFRGKKETFSQAVNRLLDIRDGVATLTSTIEGMQAYAEYRAKKLQAIKAENAPGDSGEVSHVQPGEVGARRPPVPAEHVQVPHIEDVNLF